MKTLEFHLSPTNARAAQFFRAIGAGVVESSQLSSVGYKYHQYSPDYYLPTIKVTLSLELQKALSIKSGVDVTGFVKFFGLGHPRSEKDALRAIKRNQKRWENIEARVYEVLSQIPYNE